MSLRVHPSSTCQTPGRVCSVGYWVLRGGELLLRPSLHESHAEAGDPDGNYIDGLKMLLKVMILGPQQEKLFLLQGKVYHAFDSRIR